MISQGVQLPPAAYEDVRRRFASFIRERGQRQTPERFAVLDEIYASQEHIDADTLYARIRDRGVRVSRATVYNTLELLLACDLVVRHQFGRAQAKYERAWAYWQHDHLLCLECGAIFEFCDPRLQEIQDTVAGIYGFEVARHALNVYAHCRRENCEGRQPAAR
jgi:Fur family ferric uptake transcriptional regulator